MRYGSLTLARRYEQEGRLVRWLQAFLRADGKNPALAEGLVEEDPCCVMLRRIPVALLRDVPCGAPEYLFRPNDIQYFFEVVARMKAIHPTWDAPPLIVEYRSGRFSVNDGRRRLEMYRQLGMEQVWAVLWLPREESPAPLLRLLEEQA